MRYKLLMQWSGYVTIQIHALAVRPLKAIAYDESGFCSVLSCTNIVKPTYVLVD